MYTVTINHDATAAFKKIWPTLLEEDQIDFFAQMDRIKHLGTKAGLTLDDKYDIDLRGCYKIYFGQTKYRIVYEEEPDGNMCIWAIGPREDFEVYRLAGNIKNGEG